MAEWKTCRERCYLEEFASADGKIKLYRKRAEHLPVESLLEQAVRARSELESEFGEGAFSSLEYTVHTHTSEFGAYHIWGVDQVLISLPQDKAPELSDALTVGYSRFFLPGEEAARLHELYLREACGEKLSEEDTGAVESLMTRASAAWERSYGQHSDRVLRELLRHESAHSLERNIRRPLAISELRMISLTPQEFTDYAVNDIVREGFALFVGYDYEPVIPPAIGAVFRKRLGKLFRRAETKASASYGSYLSGLDPAVLCFAGEYLAGTIFNAFGREGIRKCVAELNQKDILAWHFTACAEVGMTPLFDLSVYPYFED